MSGNWRRPCSHQESRCIKGRGGYYYYYYHYYYYYLYYYYYYYYYYYHYHYKSTDYTHASVTLQGHFTY